MMKVLLISLTKEASEEVTRSSVSFLWFQLWAVLIIRYTMLQSQRTAAPKSVCPPATAFTDTETLKLNVGRDQQILENLVHYSLLHIGLHSCKESMLTPVLHNNKTTDWPLTDWCIMTILYGHSAMLCYFVIDPLQRQGRSFHSAVSALICAQSSSPIFWSPALLLGWFHLQ